MSEESSELSPPPVNPNEVHELKTTEKPLIANNLTTLFNSESYIHQLSGFEKGERGKVIGLTLEYGILHPDMFGIEDFLEGVNDEDGREDKKIAFTMSDSIARKLGVNADTKEGRKKIFAYYNDRVQTDGVLYHGFNGSFRDKIEKEGLTTDQRMWEPEDLDKVHQIGE